MGKKRSTWANIPVEKARVQGDAALAGEALALVPPGKVFALAVAAVTPVGVRVATVGAPLGGSFEIGSITKGVTGLLYADALERGEVAQDTRLGDLLPLDGAAASAIKLQELAQHCSGLPRLITTPVETAQALWALLRAKDPYSGDAEDVVMKLRKARLKGKTPHYSNIGFAALGYALAAASEVAYPELVERRIAVPSLWVPDNGAAGLDDHLVQGYDDLGRAQDPWTSPEIAPAGGVRATAGAMGGFARMLAEGTAPGVRALDPTADFTDDGKVRIGAAWLTEEIESRPVTWHNGGTGGFSSWLGVDRGRGEAVFLAGATAAELDTAGRRLLVNLRTVAE